MEEHKKNLKITSYVIIILAIFNIVLMGIGFATGELRENAKKLMEESISQTEEVYEEVIDMTVNGTIVASTIGVLFDLYLGIAGLRQAKGTSKGKANIILAIIIFVIALIGLIPMIVSLAKNQTNISSLFSELAGLLIMFYYIRYAKKVVEQKE